jgi:predicted small lipoprotein YifL
MKKKFLFVFTLLVLMFSVVACGSSGDVVVNPPDEGEPIDVEVPTQEEATEAPKLGTARSNPAPVGSEVIVDDMAFKILGATRPADEIIMAGNQFNSAPEEGEEYVLVELQATCQKSSDDKCSLNPMFNISLIGSSGVMHDLEIVVSGVDGLLESTEFYGGATVSGTLPFIIGQDETDLILVYEPFLGDAFYLEIPN